MNGPTMIVNRVWVDSNVPMTAEVSASGALWAFSWRMPVTSAPRVGDTVRVSFEIDPKPRETWAGWEGR